MYFIVFLPILLLAPSIYSYLFIVTGIPRYYSMIIGSLIISLSLFMSFVNIVFKEIVTGPPRIQLTTRYVYFMGMYFPVIRPEVVYSRLVLAVNVGGALIPVSMSLLLLAYLLFHPRMFVAGIISLLVVTIVTYYSSRSIPRVGIVVPGFIPSLTAVLTTILLVDNPVYGVPIAYLSGTLGSLLGADVLRLLKDLKLFVSTGSSFLSIGGAGTFDGVFLSGLFAVLWVLLLSL